MSFEAQALVPEYCFHGSFTRAVDGKGRFNLPFRLRRAAAAGAGAEAPERYGLTDGPDGSLNLRPYEEFLAALNRARREAATDDERAKVRALSASSRVLEADAQGRVAIPPDVLDKIGVTKQVVVVGMVDYMELWSPEKFATTSEPAVKPDKEFLAKFYR
jgi:MraZ protein